jgi:hypothetical protein
MQRYFALLSIVYMMAFVLLFDRMHWRRRLAWQHWSGNLMSQKDAERIQKIWAASQIELPLVRKEPA